MKQVAQIVFPSSLRVLLFWQMPLLILLATGCVSYHKGYIVTGVESSSRREETVSAIKEVSLIPVVSANGVRVMAEGAAESSLQEKVRTVMHQKEKIVTIGLFPGVVAMDSPMLAFVLPIYNAVIIGAPTLASLCFEPFTSDYSETDYHGLAAFGLLGAYKYCKTAPDATTNMTRIIQRDIPRRIPLAGVKVKCDISEVSFSDFGVTDDHGKVDFTLAGLPKRRADVVLTIQDVTRNPYANLLTQYIRKPETYRMSFMGGDVASTVGVRSNLLKPATWKPEPVALAQLTAVGTSVASAQTLSEWFYNSLAETRYFALMARSDTAAILKEQKFQRNDNCDDTGCLVEMGKILSVRRMIGGSIGEVGEQAVFTARMVDVETGEIVATAKSSAAKDSATVLKMIEDGCEALCNDYAERRK